MTKRRASLPQGAFYICSLSFFFFFFFSAVHISLHTYSTHSAEMFSIAWHPLGGGAIRAGDDQCERVSEQVALKSEDHPDDGQTLYLYSSVLCLPYQVPEDDVQN